MKRYCLLLTAFALAVPLVAGTIVVPNSLAATETNVGANLNANARVQQVFASNLMILSAAVPPLNPRFPKLILNIPLGILAGLFLGVNLALLREFYDRRLRQPEELRELLEIPVLGVIERAGKPTLRKMRSLRRLGAPREPKPA